MKRGSSFFAILVAAACGDIPTVPDAGMMVDAAPTPPAAQCRAQRAVHLVGGVGGLAWFTQVWPVPAVITGYQAAYSFDNPANAKDVTKEAAHPLFVRTMGTRGLWENRGLAPQPSVFVAGSNETHTQQPISITVANMLGLVAAGAVIQSDLAPIIPVISFTPGGPYGTAPSAPTPVTVANVDAAVAAFRGMVTPAVEQSLTPSAAQLARYVPPGAAAIETRLGTQLAFIANAMSHGLVGSVIVQAFPEDPHGAFDSGIVTQRAQNLAAMLDEFYADLAKSNERTCSDGGKFLSLADNVVTVVTGDTPKNPFNNAGWGDGTPANSNWMYLRSNGFTRPGWFGLIQPGTRTNFNPNTGAADAAATPADSTAAAFAGALYAIARGDKAKVRLITSAAFDGVILR